MKKFFPLVILLVLSSIPVFAEDTIQTTTLEPLNETAKVEKKSKRMPVSLYFDTRVDWDGVSNGAVDSLAYKSSFGGTGLMFVLDGGISAKFSYHLRYRLNKQSLEHTRNLFDPADWAYLKYTINPQWNISAGKILYFYGSYEFDKNPLDVYLWSTWGTRIGAFQVGIMAQYITKDKKNNIILQVANSPFITKPFESMYGYNIQWSGKFGVFNSLYTASLMEYKNNRYATIINLGNQFNFGPVCFELDYMNRYYGTGNFFEDFSLQGKLKYTWKDRLTVFAKAGCDINPDTGENDNEKLIAEELRLVDIGMKRIYYGAGMEFFPIKGNQDLHVHLYWISGNEFEYKQHQIGVGVKYKFYALGRKK